MAAANAPRMHLKVVNRCSTPLPIASPITALFLHKIARMPTLLAISRFTSRGLALTLVEDLPPVRVLFLSTSSNLVSLLLTVLPLVSQNNISSILETGVPNCPGIKSDRLGGSPSLPLWALFASLALILHFFHADLSAGGLVQVAHLNSLLHLSWHAFPGIFLNSLYILGGFITSIWTSCPTC